MHPDDVSAYARLLNERGLNLGHETGPADFVIVHQVQGPLDQCEWLKFFRIRKEASSTGSSSLRNLCRGVTQKLLRIRAFRPEIGWRYAEWRGVH